MKILEVIHTFPPYSEGGSELYTCQLARKLISRNHEAAVFHRTADRARPEYEMRWQSYDGIPVMTLNHNYKNFHSRRIFEDPEISRLFGSFLDDYRPEIVHFHHLTNMSLSMIEEAYRRNIPAVYEMHDFWLMCPLGKLTRRDFNRCDGPEPVSCAGCTIMQLPVSGAWRRFPVLVEQKILPYALRGPAASLLRTGYDLHSALAVRRNPEALRIVLERERLAKKMCSLVDRFIVYTQAVRDQFLKWGIPEEKMVIANHGYDPATLAGAAPRTPDGRIRFGYTGALIPPKGAHILIEAFNRLKDERAELHLFGPFLPAEGFPDYEGYLRSIAKNPRIHFRGEFDHAKVTDILSEIDVLATPSLWHEGGPTTLLEAMLAGKPVLASTMCDGFKDFVEEGINGYLHAPGDIRALSAQMRKMLGWKNFSVKPIVWKDMEEDTSFHLDLFRVLCTEKRSAAAGARAVVSGGAS